MTVQNQYHDYVRNQVKEADELYGDSNLITSQAYSRVHYVVTAVFEGLGALFSALELIPQTLAFVIGEALYLPVRAFNLVQYVSANLREYAANNLAETAGNAVRLGLGAISSATVGVLYPPANSYVHNSYLLPAKA